MISRWIAQRRLNSQGLAGRAFSTPADVVRWLGAVQGQDCLGALWAIGLRMPSATEAAIERAINDRSIVRTWPMRGTLHVLAAADVRTWLALTAPRLRAVIDNAIGRRGLELDDTAFARADRALQGALEGGKLLTRAELGTRLEAAGVATDAPRLSDILQPAQGEGLICYGPRRGKQPTFALLDEWVPAGGHVEPVEALATVAGRYFRSHGPATVHDFSWWAGLPLAMARSGLDLVRSSLEQRCVAGQTYWYSEAMPPANPSAEVHLLPPYDEFLIGYKDWSASVGPHSASHLAAPETLVGKSTIVVDGTVVGTWKRTLRKRSVLVTLSSAGPIDPSVRETIEACAVRYAAFLGLPLVLA